MRFTEISYNKVVPYNKVVLIWYLLADVEIDSDLVGGKLEVAKFASSSF